MNPTHLIAPLACSVLVATAVAQTGRTMSLRAPVVLGKTASMVMEHPSSIAGHQFAMAMCSPNYPGALPISIPGQVTGVLRLDPFAFAVLGIGVLDPSGVSPALTFLVPSDPLLVGLSFDVQGADIDGLGLVTLTDNDLEIQVAAPPAQSLNMVEIAAGTFAMGSLAWPLESAPYYNQYESIPRHTVTITRPFWMGQYEVTQAEYQAVMGSDPSFFTAPVSPGSVNRPVEQVSWNMAIAYCDVLTAQESTAGRLPSGYEYRLPTEAEWEYCCRAGTTTEFHYGPTLLCGQANFANSNHGGQPCNPVGTVPVGGFSPNAWGLHDMHGNVWEWCLDSWDLSINYPDGPVSDPYVTVGLNRIARGGSFLSASSQCRSACRVGLAPGVADLYIGFRVVCAPIL